MKVQIGNKYEPEKLKLTPDDRMHINKFVAASAAVWTGLADGETVCIWGVVPPTLLSERVYIWLYVTDAIKDHQFVFIRHSQRVIEELLKEYNVIVGHVLIGASKHTFRWLKWLGAEFGEPDGKFIPYQIRKKQNG